MSSTQVITQTTINEGADYTFTRVFDDDTSGLTLTAKIRASSASSGTGTSVSTASGDSAGETISWTLSLSGESAGEYDFEIVDGNGKVWYPQGNHNHRFVIRDRFSV